MTGADLMAEEKTSYRVGATPILFNGERVEPGKPIELTEDEAADLDDHVSPVAAEAKTTKKGGNA
ncbi:hypothetical protein [Ralstonia solanacearum]|uniref:hypothetical protein n=1 Tax=Ralstonia solanacearum TaxID=305 RepID=UPI0001D94B7B|nr:hypothetical protein [Ralstonia solanacearum]CBJ43008.1 protein of unknown function [Ralstonia solanacearum CFBP2957]